MTDTEQNARPTDQPRESLGKTVVETVLLVALAFAIAMGVKTFIVQPFVIPTGSMIPTIKIGDRVFAEKITYRIDREPAYADVIVFSNPLQNPPILIKRVIATGGQSVDLKDGDVYIDGQPLDEPYTHGKPSEPLNPAIQYPFTVPDDSVWVMGDNRTNSGDSREIGPIKVDAVLGRAVWTYWPPSSWGTLD